MFSSRSEVHLDLSDYLALRLPVRRESGSASAVASLRDPNDPLHPGVVRRELLFALGQSRVEAFAYLVVCMFDQKSRVEYIHEWQHDDAWRRIESYVSYAVALLTPQQSLRAFQEITGRKFVPRNAKIYVSD